jgi:hypothetical protein
MRPREGGSTFNPGFHPASEKRLKGGSLISVKGRICPDFVNLLFYIKSLADNAGADSAESVSALAGVVLNTREQRLVRSVYRRVWVPGT